MSLFGWLGEPAVLPWVALAFGLCVGSFVNVVIHRLPKMMDREWRAQCAELAGREPNVEPRYNLAVPRSACPSCGHRIGALENVPVFSWIWLRGKCSACGAAIGARYPIVELACGVIAAYAASRHGFTLAALGTLFFCCSLIALAWIDFDTQLLPDDLTLPLLWAGLALNLGGTFAPLGSAVMGAIAGYLALWLIYWMFKLVTGKEGMGYGDFKLLAAIGAWLGWQMLPLVILMSSIVGAVVGIALIAFDRDRRGKPIPFGPYLAAAGVIALLWGPEISRRWLPVVA
ncbi:MAG: methyltransferase [Betaproteobacteria bacterium RIFCSPLOWO2_02_FULL_66_14]|nr:MAG: methyltransferase [Betaproteobacteria bacterium RIFCSPLOWO2_02_FULL_66_14]